MPRPLEEKLKEDEARGRQERQARAEAALVGAGGEGGRDEARGRQERQARAEAALVGAGGEGGRRCGTYAEC